MIKLTNMKKPFLYVLAICYSTITFGQGINSEELVRRVADNVIQHTTFDFVNQKTGDKFQSTTSIPAGTLARASSSYNRWEYVNGVLTIGMMETALVLNDKKYSDYSLHNFDFIFSNLAYFENLNKTLTTRVEYAPVFNIASLDDCGAMSAGLMDVNALVYKKEYRAYLDRAANYISHKQLRFADGTLSRPQPRNMTIWADDLFMSVPFLARMGKLTGDRRYFDDAIKQVENFNKYLYDPASGLFFHNYYSEVGMNGVAHWGRCNGWLAMAQVELLKNLPANHPKRAQLIKLLLRQMVGFSRYQDQTGLWHQVLDKPDSYLETSVTAMFVYAIAHSVNEGWIDPTYMTIAREGWKGLASKVTDDGQLQDVCVGTGIEDNIEFYYTRPTKLNDTHGLGAFLLAGDEMIKAGRKK